MTIEYVHHSPSALNLFAASPSMFVLERIMGLQQPVGVPAHRGVAVEAGVAHGLFNPNATLVDCIKAAVVRYDTIAALSSDARRERYRETIEDMVKRALAELRPYGVPTETQGLVEWRPEGLRLPIVGYFDFVWGQHGIIIDLKTTERMPSEIKIPHARQVALYATSDNMDARLTYVTPRKCETYELENIREHREALRQIAMKIENLLALSDDPEFFKSITVPDLESFYWGGPRARQLAFEHWGV
jgi:CRISPR/Cas system-associated exonuclease Cas4 (RecB family)